MKLPFAVMLRASLAVVATLFVACSAASSSAPPSPPVTGCTEEAKVCPDGSSVARTGPNCEFAPCPAATAPPVGEVANCKDECGNGTCEEVVCQAVGCPCSESKTSCPKDCS